MPESVVHDEAVTLLRAILAAWAARVGTARVTRNLAVRWIAANPLVGVDPDVAVFAPPPPALEDLNSVRTWVDGHEAPLVAIEVVSENDPRKDYVIAPDKYAASGTRELWIFDPLLAGPTSHGGPFRLQVWRRDDEGFTRTHAGEGPAFSPALGAWLVVVAEGRRLRVADDRAASNFWLTAEEAERAAKERERIAKDDALARVAALEAELQRLRGG